MATILKPQGTFIVTPHKVSICILLHVYHAPPVSSDQNPFPFPFSSISHHNRFAVFLLALTKACDDFLEPKLEELIAQLKEVGGLQDEWLVDHLISRLTSISSPDDLFNFFNSLRGILSGPDTLEVDQIILDSSSTLGIYLRHCILAFNILSFEGVCHLLTTIGIYYKESLSVHHSYGSPHLDGYSNDSETLVEYENMDYENMDLENMVLGKVSEEIEARKQARDRVPFYMHAPTALQGLLQDIQVSADMQFKQSDKAKEVGQFAVSPNQTFGSVDFSGSASLRTNWQVQGFLAQQADAFERHVSSFSLNAFESILKKLLKLAPELHRVHFLRYLNNVYHHDYPSALENLHRYFDYSAGTEGFDLASPSSGCNASARHEIALLCLGMMHFHFGHPTEGLEALTEAVRVSQEHSNDTCLAYTLEAICSLLSDVGISSSTGILGSASLMRSIGPSISIQQELFLLLRRSLKRAESLKLRQLLASNHLAMAKFDLTHVQRPLLSFGRKASIRFRTSPVNVCKELRLSSRLISDFGSESSSMTVDGCYSNVWLKDLQKPMNSLVLLPEDVSANNSAAFDFCAQPSSIPSSVTQTVGSSYLLRATAWQMNGSAPLGRLNALVYATCFADSSSLPDDAELSYAKLIQHLAVYKGYKEAFSALKIVEEKFLSISKSRIQLLKLQLLHERALHRGHLKLAHRFCNELGALASPTTGVDMELKTEAKLRLARTLLAAKQFSQAAEAAHSLFCMCYKFNLQVENATVLLLLAEIHQKAGNAVLGLPYALASLSYCQSFNLDLLKASATLTLAELWLSLGEKHARRAVSLIHEAFVMILGHGGLELRARAYLAEAKCYLADLSFSVTENPEAVLTPLRQASDELEILEYHELAAEAYYLTALIFNKLGNLEEREVAAASFKKHILLLEHPEDNPDVL